MPDATPQIGPPLDFNPNSWCCTGEVRIRRSWFGLARVEEQWEHQDGKRTWRALSSSITLKTARRNGGVDIVATVKQIVSGHIAGAGTGKPMERFGLSPLPPQGAEANKRLPDYAFLMREAIELALNDMGTGNTVCEQTKRALQRALVTASREAP